MAVIEVNHLVKEYKVMKKDKGLSGSIKNLFFEKKKIIRAVDDISFKIERGEIVAYIGPNGAGKSTTVKMMSGILAPTDGEIRIKGKDPQKNRKEVVMDLGVVFGQRTQLNWDLRLGESFELLKYIYKIDEKKYKDNFEELDEILNISKIIDTPVRQLSLGQRMRGDLAAAMLHSPSVLFLDEPTIGLDVDGKYAIRKFIKEINEKRSTTIILTTHDLGDIQELCKRLIIINNGKLVEDGSLEDLIDKIAPYKYLIVDFFNDQVIEHPKADIVSKEGNRAVYRFCKTDITAAKLIGDITQNTKIQDVKIEESKIDDIIRVAYQ